MAGYTLASREQNLEGGEGASQAAKASPGLGRAKKGRALPLPRRAKPGSGREPTRVGSCPGSAFAAEGEPWGTGVARPKPSKQGMAAHGAAIPTLRSPGRAETPLGWSPAPFRLRGRRRAEAERRRERPSLCKVRAGPGAYSGGARVRFSLCCRRRARRQGRRQAEAERCRGGHSLSPPWRSLGWAGSPFGWGPAEIYSCLCLKKI